MPFLTKTYRYGRLVHAAQAGDEEAFAKLFENTKQKLFAYAVIKSSGREDAVDLVEETYIELWRALPTFNYRSDNEFMGFLFLILKRKLIRYHEQRKETTVLEDDVKDPTPLPKPDEYGVHDLLTKLRPEYAEVLELRYWSDLKFTEIAAFMNEKQSTIKTWHRRALKELNNLLKEYA